MKPVENLIKYCTGIFANDDQNKNVVTPDRLIPSILEDIRISLIFQKGIFIEQLKKLSTVYLKLKNSHSALKCYKKILGFGEG